MSVTGYLSLYTTLLGWQQYQSLWYLFTQSGLIYLPFIGIVVTTCMTPFTSMGAKDAAQIALRRLGIRIITALFVIAFACVPTVQLTPSILHFEKACSDSKAELGHTNTTYDNAFPVPTSVKVPLLWYLGMAISNGVTHAAIKGLSCSPINYRELHDQLNMSQIVDPTLKEEVIGFHQACYVPAYSDYLANQFDSNKKTEIQNYIKKYGNQDTQWLGSQIFLRVPGFYDAHHALKPVTGFKFDNSKDIEENQIANHSEFGKPNCLKWWSDPFIGLHVKLKNALPIDFMKGILDLGQPDMEDLAVKKLIKQSFSESLEDVGRGYSSLEDNMTGDYITRFVGEPLGIAFENLKYYPKIHLLINALPIIQGSLLFAFYAFLAIAIPFSGYKIEFCITATIVLFSVIFCSYIWHLVAWFDNHLIPALYPDNGLQGVKGILSGNMVNERFVNMIIATLYIVLPLFWMTVMSWVSFKVGGFLSSLGAMSGPVESAASNASQTAKMVITSSINKIK